MLDYDIVKGWTFPDVVQTYSHRDTILYALGLGFGEDPVNPDGLRFVFEARLATVPTMAAVLGSPGFFWQTPSFGVDWVKIVHGEQDVEWFAPLPPEGTVIGRNAVVGLTDKGPGKGVVAQVVRDIVDQRTGDRLARARQLVMLRGNGGYSADGGVSDPPADPLPVIEESWGAPDAEFDLPTSLRAALIYRLSGDFNPLHVDPQIAAAAGYERPILHGLCTYGMAARALLDNDLGGDFSRLRRLAVRFTAPVIPGETVRFQFWRREPGRVHLRARVAERGVIVLNNGFADILDHAPA